MLYLKNNYVFSFFGSFFKNIEIKIKRWTFPSFFGQIGWYLVYRVSRRLLSISVSGFWISRKLAESWARTFFFSHNFGQKQPKNKSVGIGLGQFSELLKSTQNNERLLPKDPIFQISAHWSKKWRTWNIFFSIWPLFWKMTRKWENYFFSRISTPIHLDHLVRLHNSILQLFSTRPNHWVFRHLLTKKTPKITIFSYRVNYEAKLTKNMVWVYNRMATFFKIFDGGLVWGPYRVDFERSTQKWRKIFFVTSSSWIAMT